MRGQPDPAPGAPPEGRPAPPREAVQRWRLVVRREPGTHELPQRASLAAWADLFAARGLPVAGLDGSPPRPRFAVAAPLPGAMGAHAELIDVYLVERLPRWRVREALAGPLPDGCALVDVYDAWLGEPALPGQVVASVYGAELPRGIDREALREAVASMLAAASLPRERRKADRTVEYDLRPFLESLELAPPAVQGGSDVVRMTLRHDPEKGVGRPEEVLAELGSRVGTGVERATLVRERLVLAADRPAPVLGAGAQAPAAGKKRPRK